MNQMGGVKAMKTGLNNEGMQRANRNLVLSLLLKNDHSSRADIAKQTNLQKATITNIVNEFLDAGILREQSLPKEDGKRKTTALNIYAPHVVVLSARITREFFLALAFSLDGSRIEKRKTLINCQSPISETLPLIFDTLDDMVGRLGESNIVGMCLGMPGPYIRNGKNVVIVTGFEELGKADIQEMLDKRYSFPCITEHDAKLAAFAEWNSLDAETQAEEDSLIAVQSIGIGIGSGAVLGGKIYHGAVGIAGEVGHMGINFFGEAGYQGNRGTYESYAATGATIRYVRERLYEFGDSPLHYNSSYDEIIEAYKNGDQLAAAALDKLAWMLSYGLVSLVFILNPNRIILSDAYPKTDAFLQRVIGYIEKMLYPELMHSVKILYSSIDLDSTILGGYYLVLEKLIKDNLLLDSIKKIEDREA